MPPYRAAMDREKWSARQVKLLDALKNIRIESGQTQTELAEKLHRPQSYVSKYESGERRLDFIEVSDICSSCGVTLTEFVRKVGI